MLVRRSFAAIGVVLSAQALLACSSSDPGEDVAEITQPFSYNFAGKLSGKLSDAGTVGASRGAGLLDLFTIWEAGPGLRNVLYYRFRDGIGWSSGVVVGTPPSMVGSLAVAENGGRIDLFAAGQDGKIYHKVSAAGGGALQWVVDWYEVPGATVKNPLSGNAITVTSWADGRLDLFWVTPAGNIGHKWADGFVWSGIETGDGQNGAWYLKPIAGGPYTQSIESVSTGPGRLEVILGSHGTSPGIKNHWFRGFWGTAYVPCCRANNGEIFNYASNFVLTPVGPGDFSFDVYLFIPRPGNQNTIDRFTWTDGWGWDMVNGLLTAGGTTYPAIPADNRPTVLNDGLMWTSNGTRKDIFGWSSVYNGSDLAWRMFF